MSVVKWKGSGREVPGYDVLLENVPDFEEMEEPALRDFRSRVEAAIEELNEAEPRDENSEAYDIWAEKHEDLEDILDEVLDLLEEME